MSDSCDPVDCSPPGSSVYRIFWARIVQWIAISFSRGSSRPRNWTKVFCIAGRFFTYWARREAWYIAYLFTMTYIVGNILSVFLWYNQLAMMYFSYYILVSSVCWYPLKNLCIILYMSDIDFCFYFLVFFFFFLYSCQVLVSELFKPSKASWKLFPFPVFS